MMMMLGSLGAAREQPASRSKRDRLRRSVLRCMGRKMNLFSPRWREKTAFESGRIWQIPPGLELRLLGSHVTDHCLGARIHKQLSENVLQMAAHGVNAHTELVGDQLVGIPLGKQQENLFFPH